MNQTGLQLRLPSRRANALLTKPAALLQAREAHLSFQRLLNPLSARGRASDIVGPPARCAVLYYAFHFCAGYRRQPSRALLEDITPGYLPLPESFEPCLASARATRRTARMHGSCERCLRLARRAKWPDRRLPAPSRHSSSYGRLVHASCVATASSSDQLLHDRRHTRDLRPKRLERTVDVQC